MPNHCLRIVFLAAVAAAALISPAAGADNMLTSLFGKADTAAKKVSFAERRDAPAPAAALAESDALVFTAAPRETAEEGAAIYGPIADYLAQAIGRKVVYRHPRTWGAYRTEMLNGAYDLVFDGPHFNSYRAEKLNHNILVKIPTGHEFVAIVKKDEPFASAREMVGRTFCAHAPPNLGTLILLGQFDNPARQPMILNTEGWDRIYAGVVSGRCTGGVLPLANLKKLDKEGRTKIVYQARAIPNQALSAGPRLTANEQALIVEALLAPEAAGPTERLRAAYKVGEHLAATSNREYAGLADYLKTEWGFY